MVPYRFANTLSKNLNEFCNFVFNCRFYFVFLVYLISCLMTEFGCIFKEK